MVVCGDGLGKLINKSEESMAICVEPWKYKIVYTSSDKNRNVCPPGHRARWARWEPSLDDYEREEQSDTVPKEWKKGIDAFHGSHNHTLPNTNDLAKRTYPVYRSQTETKTRIYHSETWDQLWSKFEKMHPGIADKICNLNAPMECPTFLWKHALWEIVKGKYPSCLCVNCEGVYDKFNKRIEKKHH